MLPCDFHFPILNWRDREEKEDDSFLTPSGDSGTSPGGPRSQSPAPMSPHLAPNAPVQRHRDSFSSIFLCLWQEAAVKAVCLPRLICYSYTPRGGVLCFHCLRDGICFCYALEKQPTVVQGAGRGACGLGSQQIFVVWLAAAADPAFRSPAASQPPLPCEMP